MKKTLIASAILLATSGVVMASTPGVWVDAGKDTTTFQNEDPNGSHLPYIKDSELSIDKDAYVFDKKAHHVTTDANGNAILAAKNNQTIINKGSLWVTGTGNGDGMTNIYGQKGTLINQGTIYVDGSSRTKNKGMVVNPEGKAINEGNIVVRDGASGMIDASGGNNKSLINNGVITVVGNGAGIYFRKEGGNSNVVENNNAIFVTGTGTGVLLQNDKPSYEQKTFTNTGLISATGEKSTAIHDLNSGAHIKLMNDSQVDGLVKLTDKTTLEFVNNIDTISLDSRVGTVIIDEASNITIEQGSDKVLKVGTLNVDSGANTQFKLRRIANEGETILSVGTVEGDGKDAVAVGYTGNVSDELLQGADAKLLTSGVSLGGETVESVTVDQGLSGDALVVDKNGNVKTVQANSLITSAQDVAVASALMWRDQLSSLSDRMGTLRTMPGEVGSWARYTNGRLDGNDIEHDFNTIEVGFDKKINDTVALGASFAYTKGDTDVIAGTADNNTYTGGLYATYMNESNCFFDAMLKIGRIDAEYDLMTSAGAESADYMMTGTIFGIEAGHRWNVQNFYVEPALQVTYSHIRPASYTSSIERQVKYEAMESLIAKVGVTGGMTFAEKGAAFAAVSYNHDFMGDVEGRYTHNSITRTFEDELDDNWGEAKLGASYQVTNGLNAFADVATTFGGDIDQKWRVNIGARYVF